MSKLGFLAIGRPTFDVPFAEAQARKAFDNLASSAVVAGTPALLMDSEAVTDAARELEPEHCDSIVVFQATFADSTLVAAIAENLSSPLILWAIPEARSGGRLRLNSLCGVNLAAYFLTRSDRDYSWVYSAPDAPSVLGNVVQKGRSQARHPQRFPERVGSDGPDLSAKMIGVLGSRPDGFEPCDFEADELISTFGVKVDQLPLSDWFSASEVAADGEIAEIRSSVGATMSGLEGVDQAELDRSLRLYTGLSGLASERGWSGLATRCWPECFTEFGGAACAGNSMMTSSGIPGCCEADVYGTLTALLLGELSDDPPFIADLIDIEASTNTAVFWHCGQAPHELAASKPTATLHSNRKKPLLNQFALKPGTVTLARVSQSNNMLSLVVGKAEMLDEPLPFSGTAGVARLDSDVNSAFDTIMENGLEHHYGIGYGDHVEKLLDFAAQHDLSVTKL